MAAHPLLVPNLAAAYKPNFITGSRAEWHRGAGAAPLEVPRYLAVWKRARTCMLWFTTAAIAPLAATPTSTAAQR